MRAHTCLKHHARQHALAQRRRGKHNAVRRHPQVAAVRGQEAGRRRAQVRDAEFAFGSATAASVGVGVAHGGRGRQAAQTRAVLGRDETQCVFVSS